MDTCLLLLWWMSQRPDLRMRQYSVTTLPHPMHTAGGGGGGSHQGGRGDVLGVAQRCPGKEGQGSQQGGGRRCGAGGNAGTTGLGASAERPVPAAPEWTTDLGALCAPSVCADGPSIRQQSATPHKATSYFFLPYVVNITSCSTQVQASLVPNIRIGGLKGVNRRALGGCSGMSHIFEGYLH